MKTVLKTLKQTVRINAKPSQIYEALTNPEIHSQFTQNLAENTDKLGAFSTYGGYSSGKNLELVKDKKIVQTWTCDDFPEGHYTTVTLEFKEEKQGTTLKLIQTSIPIENYEDIAAGWIEYYWKPLKVLLEPKNGLS